MDATAVEVSDAVGGEVCDFDTELVVADLESILAIEDEGDGPSAADELTVNIDAGRLADIAEVNLPAVRSLHIFLRQFYVGGVYAGAHRDANGVVVEGLPGLGGVKRETLDRSGRSVGEGEGPRAGEGEGVGGMRDEG